METHLGLKNHSEGTAVDMSIGFMMPVLRKNSIQGFRLDLAIRCCGMIVV